MIGTFKEFSEIMKLLDKQIYPSKRAINSQDLRVQNTARPAELDVDFVYVHFSVSQGDLPLQRD